MSPVTWGKVEAGEAVRLNTYAGIERAFGWSTGAIEHFVATGDEPIGGRRVWLEPWAPGLMIDMALGVDRDPAVKVDLVWIIRSGGNPIDMILELDRDDHHKVEVLAAYRDIEKQVRYLASTQKGA
ncbi:hypothetical protein [Phytohabitans aurantiacus]|nr:hypothetical protein [Phytohabitans aurantiacus]